MERRSQDLRRRRPSPEGGGESGHRPCVLHPLDRGRPGKRRLLRLRSGDKRSEKARQAVQADRREPRGGAGIRSDRPDRRAGARECQLRLRHRRRRLPRIAQHRLRLYLLGRWGERPPLRPQAVRIRPAEDLRADRRPDHRHRGHPGGQDRSALQGHDLPLPVHRRGRLRRKRLGKRDRRAGARRRDPRDRPRHRDRADRRALPRRRLPLPHRRDQPLQPRRRRRRVHRGGHPPHLRHLPRAPRPPTLPQRHPAHRRLGPPPRLPRL